MASSYQKDDISQYESGEEWEIGLGNLIIDLDADLEKETVNTKNCLNDSSPFRIGKMKIKRKISTNTKSDANVQIRDDTVDSMPQNLTEEKNTKECKQQAIIISKFDKTASSARLFENSLNENKPKNKSGNDNMEGGTMEFKEENKNEGEKKSKESSEKETRKHKVDQQASFDHVGIGTTEIGTLTEPDKLGPCEPGTSVNLEGIVWHETAEGVLVVNVTWRNKTYVGTLMDCTKHNWAPPRFCESPVIDVDAKAQTTKGRTKRSRNSISVTDLSNYTETRSSIHCKLRNSTNYKGRRGNNIPIATVSHPDKTFNGKRKVKISECELTLDDDKVIKKIKNTKTPQLIHNENLCTPYTISPGLIECPEPNCSKKYKHINGLRYHQTHAHQELPKKMHEPLDVPDSEEIFTDFADMDTKESETLNPIENFPQPYLEDTVMKTDNDSIIKCTDEDNQKDVFENYLPKIVVGLEDEILSTETDISKTVTEYRTHDSLIDTQYEDPINLQQKLTLNKQIDKDFSIFDFNSTVESDEHISLPECRESPSGVIEDAVKSSITDSEVIQSDMLNTESNGFIFSLKSPAVKLDQELLKIEKNKKIMKVKSEKLLIKPKPNRPIAPVSQLPQQLIPFPTVVTAPTTSVTSNTISPTTLKQPATIIKSSTLKPIQSQVFTVDKQVVNCVSVWDDDKELQKSVKEMDKQNLSSMKKHDTKSVVQRFSVTATETDIANLKAVGSNPSELEPNILKQALTQSGINLDDYNNSSPSCSDSIEFKDSNKDLTCTPLSLRKDTVGQNTSIPEPPKLILTSSLPAKQASVVMQPTQPKPLQQFEKNMAEKPVMSVLPAVKGTTVRPQEDPLSRSSQEQNRTQSPAYSDISDANDEDTDVQDRIDNVKEPYGQDSVLTEKRSFYPTYSGVIVHDRSHSPLIARPKIPKLIPKQRIERDIEVQENSQNNYIKQSNTAKIYQHPQLYTPHHYPPFYFGYPNHIDTAASSLHMITSPPFDHKHELREKDQRDENVTNIDSKGQRNVIHNRIEKANIESMIPSNTLVKQIDKKAKRERTDHQVEIHSHFSEKTELKPQSRILSPEESSQNYDHLLRYYMYPHAQWEDSRQREIDEKRKVVKSHCDVRKHKNPKSAQSPIGQCERKDRLSPESPNSTDTDSKSMQDTFLDDKPNKIEGPYSQYMQPSYMLPYSVIGDQYRQPMVTYQQYLPPQFSYPPVWKTDDKGSPVNDTKCGQHIPQHSCSSPEKLKEILPDGKIALDVLKQHASQLMYPRNKEHLRGLDGNQASNKSKTPERSSIDEMSQHSPRPQMQHLHMHHHTHLGYPMMTYGQIIAGNHPQASATALNPYTATTRE